MLKMQIKHNVNGNTQRATQQKPQK